MGKYVLPEGLAFTDVGGKLPNDQIDLEELHENAVPYEFCIFSDDISGIAYLTPEGMIDAVCSDLYPGLYLEELIIMFEYDNAIVRAA